MKAHKDIEQRTPAWDAVRTGKITASVAGKLLTPAGKPSKQKEGEVGRILAEEFGLQRPESIPPTYWIERGIELEPEARGWMQVLLNTTIVEWGFAEDDDGLAGFSPDGIIDDTIPVEMKVPKPSTHIKYLMNGVLPPEYKGQVHFAMAIMGAPYAYFFSYCPELKPLLIKVEADDYTALMRTEIDEFKLVLQEWKDELIAEDSP